MVVLFKENEGGNIMNQYFESYKNSLTKQAERMERAWVKELINENSKIMRYDIDRLVDYLNQEESLCTPGFLIRRQIQFKFINILEQAVEISGQNYEDLLNGINKKWSDELIHKLSILLTKSSRTAVGSSRAVEWAKWMKDEQIPTNRVVILRIAFSLEMDDTTMTKFMLSCNQEVLSVRNPLDCICLYVRKGSYPYDWERALNLLEKYEREKEAYRREVNTKTISSDELKEKDSPKIGMTRTISDRIDEIADSYLPESEIFKADDELINFMVEISEQFTKAKGKGKGVYKEGFSLERRKKLLELSKYLVLLYPEIIFEGDYVESPGDMRSKYVDIDNEGYPNLRDLTLAMTRSPMDVFDTLENDDEIERLLPFNRDVIKLFYQYVESYRLKGIERIIESSTNADIVERKDVLLLAYFFVSGFYHVNAEKRKEIRIFAEKNKESNDEHCSNLAQYVSEIINKLLNNISSKPLDIEKIHIECFNEMLKAFSFDIFYPAFVLDRFILLAIIGEDVQKIKQLIADKMYASYRN